MLHLQVPTMACGGCAKSVTKAVLSIDPDARVQIEMVTREVRVATRQNSHAVIAALAQAGFPAERKADVAV
ncbi:heavy-metal-associated domain-containing protein [Geminicoccus roseus]|uniref:heavy-metal-associated domain-containing protein n=1 Tax=Geminicoccus roseus TaxID=404900 RepID=UPI0004194F71|nr:heavy-metal-associated domain-containing protein [Geminicoccus roseus]